MVAVQELNLHITSYRGRISHISYFNRCFANTPFASIAAMLPTTIPMQSWVDSSIMEHTTIIPQFPAFVLYRFGIMGAVVITNPVQRFALPQRQPSWL